MYGMRKKKPLDGLPVTSPDARPWLRETYYSSSTYPITLGGACGHLTRVGYKAKEVKKEITYTRPASTTDKRRKAAECRL